MSKFAFLFLGFFLTATSFAAKFEVSSEQRVYNIDGSPKPDSVYVLRYEALQSNGENSYQIVLKTKAVTAQGKVLRDTAYDQSDFSSEKVQHLGNIFSLCANFKGEIEALTIKAGSFQACKQSQGPVTEWYIEGVPFSVKRAHRMSDRVSITEAVEIKVAP